MKITIDYKKCISCGTCAALASKTFKINKKGKVEILTEKPDLPTIIQTAVDSCPSLAIKFNKV